MTADLGPQGLFEWILSGAHPELTPVMRNGVIDRIRFFREVIWDGWLHAGLKRFVHGSGAIEGWGFCEDEEEEEDFDEDGFCLLEEGHARGLAKTGAVCDECGRFQGKRAIAVPKATDIAQIQEMPRTEKEVANHAKALTHAMERMIVGEPTRDGADLKWTEEFIKEIHSTLVDGLCCGEGKGEYRTDHDEVGDEFTTDADEAEADTEAEDGASVISLPSSSSSLFTDHSFIDDDEGDTQDKKNRYLSEWIKRDGKMCLRASTVKEHMGRMVEELNQDIETIRLAHAAKIPPIPSPVKTDNSSEQTQKITTPPHHEEQQRHQQQPEPLDPYSVAAKHTHQFLMISPFTSGNGIISRIIMNVLLLKYAGKIAPFGANIRGKRSTWILRAARLRNSMLRIWRGLSISQSRLRIWRWRSL